MVFRRRADEVDTALAGTADERLTEAVAAIRMAFADVGSAELTARPELADILFSGVETPVAPSPTSAPLPGPWTGTAMGTGSPVRSHRPRRLVVAGVLAAALATGTGLAGALPGPVQTVFDRASSAVGLDRAPAPADPAVPGADVVGDDPTEDTPASATAEDTPRTPVPVPAGDDPAPPPSILGVPAPPDRPEPVVPVLPPVAPPPGPPDHAPPTTSPPTPPAPTKTPTPPSPDAASTPGAAVPPPPAMPDRP